jgi:hypothetical protein
MLAITLAMGILNLTAFASLMCIKRFFVATIAADIFIVVVSYVVLWFFREGQGLGSPLTQSGLIRTHWCHQAIR